jgi:cytochrome P450
MSTAAPPGPPGHLLLGNLLELSRDHLGFVHECVRRYGDVVVIRFGRRPVVVISDPRDVEYVLVTNQRNFSKGYFYRLLGPAIGNGLLTSEGDFWRRQRRLAQPAFHHQRINAYAETMTDYSHQALATWRAGEQRNVHEDLMRLTLRIVGKTLFGADIEKSAPVVGRALPRAIAEVNAQMTGPEFLLPGGLPTPSRIRLRRAVAQLDPVVLRLIAERRASPDDNGDLLSALLRAQDEDGDQMSNQQLRDEAMTIVLAGHETTALALTWALYLLSATAPARVRIEEEVDAVLAGRPPGLAEVARLPFTEAVILEALRLYPPAFGFGREVIERCEIGDYQLEPGTSIYIVPWVIQRDPRWFDEPDQFRPERWLDGLAKRLPRFAYFPFGGGPRLCIGQQFAKLEAIIILSSIVQRWRLDLVPGQNMTPKPAITLRPRNGMTMTVSAR